MRNSDRPPTGGAALFAAAQSHQHPEPDEPITSQAQPLPRIRPRAMTHLAGKVAIVTGGSTGLGREIALAYASRGATVVIADIRADDADRTAAELRAAGGNAAAVVVNVTDGAAVQALIAETEERFGRLDIMTANAGILGRGAMKSLVDMTDEEFSEIVDVNFYGVYFSFKYAIPAILRAGGGAMTATSSVAAQRGFATLPAYSASKAAVDGLVRALAADLAPWIRVNAVAPGGMETDMARHMAEEKGLDPAAVSLPDTPEAFPRAKPSQVAQAHLFLVSPGCEHINGQVLVVDGGQSILP